MPYFCGNPEKSAIYIMRNMLDYIQANGDIKKLSIDELNCLCGEIRSFLIKNISKTGGHLASNLGVVELTVAIHRVFNLPEDKLVFDVGHQSYVHKILTGRMNRFDTLRQFGGLSGFPKRSESEYDVFDTGHSSTSVSAALGMARTRDLNGDKYSVLALFGDGALTGGEIYEALNDAGHDKTQLILILNDNAMSISKNVGAMSKHLRNLRINRLYFKSKKSINSALDRMPRFGKIIKKPVMLIKNAVRHIVLPTTLFDELGFQYIGPVNGHDMNSLITCFNRAKEERRPVIIHVRTYKGKGYLPAEQDPSFFHGVGEFDPETGTGKAPTETYSSCFGRALSEIADKNKKVTAVTCAMPDGTGLDEFIKNHKHRFFDVGIAEQHGVTFAAGMAANGYIPVIPLYSTFLQRAYDQTLHDVCLQNLHVVFPIDRAGIVGADGETHQGVYDLSFLSSMPNMTVLSPSSFNQLRDMLDYAINIHNAPIAVRYPRGSAQTSGSYEKFEIGKAYTHSFGNDVSVITSGRMLITAEAVRDTLKVSGISMELIELPTVNPINEAAVIAAAMKTGNVVTIEDNVKPGGLGERIAAILLEHNVSCKFKIFAFPPSPIVHGTVTELDKKYNMDAASITEYITASLR